MNLTTLEFESPVPTTTGDAASLADALREFASLIESSPVPMPARIEVTHYEWRNAWRVYVGHPGEIDPGQVAAWVHGWKDALNLDDYREKPDFLLEDGRRIFTAEAEGRIGQLYVHVWDSARLPDATTPETSESAPEAAAIGA